MISYAVTGLLRFLMVLIAVQYYPFISPQYTNYEAPFVKAFTLKNYVTQLIILIDYFTSRSQTTLKKPMKTVDQLIAHMKNKGVRFSVISETDAKLHLDKHNNYFKLTSYRKNYTKITTGPNAGQYENLEFAHLIELARLDTEIRHILLQMTLDIEHFMKVALIKAVEDRMANNGDEDGYKVIEGYLLADDIIPISDRAQAMAKRNRQFAQKINQNKHNPYCEGLINRYS
ncbi:MAG: Abi family protein, partial [Paludibacteraceae bacterium]|nr:Abi family protein [Paludibacteraceae bacterium]